MAGINKKSSLGAIVEISEIELLAKGSLITSTGLVNYQLTVGTNGYFLKADSSLPNGIGWTNKFKDDEILLFGTGNDASFKYESVENRLALTLLNNANFYLASSFINTGEGSKFAQYKFSLVDTANNAYQKIGLSLELTKADNFNVTSDIDGMKLIIHQAGTGTIDQVLGFNSEIQIDASGIISIGVSYAATHLVDTGSTMTDYVAFASINSQGTSAPATSYLLSAQSQFIANNFTFRFSPTFPPTEKFVPFSNANTGITWDSQGFTLATTTSGNITIDPFGSLIINTGAIDLSA